MANLDVEKQIPVVAVRELVVFPGTVVPLYVGRDASLAAVEVALKGDGQLLCLTQRDAEKEEISAKDLYRFGTVTKILQAVRMPDGNMKLLVEGSTRAKVIKLAKERSLGCLKRVLQR